MCDATSDGIGDLVPDDTILYRGCSRKNFLTLAKDAVQPEAFQKRTSDTDGLSLALTMADSVKGLDKNHGAISIRVRDIRALNRGLEVRFDTLTANHVLIRNLPCMDKINERMDAEARSAELALLASVECPNSISVLREIAEPSTHQWDTNR
jgi:hypothetical protein